jgi:RNA polymerase sigma factor (sigma-70 family)
VRALVTTAVGQEPSIEAQDAFGELVRRFQDTAFAYAYAILRERTAAEDAVQAAFLTAWLHRRELNEPAAFGGWLRTIVRTECHRILRQPRLTTVSLDAVEPPRVDADEETLLTRELRQLLLKAIRDLPDADRAVILLKYASESSYQDLSLFLNKPIGTVKKRLHVARRRLRASLERVALGEFTRRVFDEYRPSRNLYIERRIMTATRFLEKIATGDVATVAAVLEAQPALLEEPGPGRMWTGSVDPLTIAVGTGHLPIVTLLIAKRAPLARTQGRPSFVALAAIEGHHAVVDALRQAGAEVDIFALCALGDTEGVHARLAEDRSLVHVRTADGKTPLHFARSVAVAERLIQDGADLNAVDDTGQTPLQWIAATGRYKALANSLKAHGARAESSDIFWACAYGDLAAVRRFLEVDRSVVTARRPSGVSVHAVAVGLTPLHEAAARGEDDIVELLLASGAEVHARGGQNKSAPLHAAAAGGHASTVRILLASGADPRAKDGVFGATPDQWAMFFGHSDLAETLKGEARSGGRR